MLARRESHGSGHEEITVRIEQEEVDPEKTPLIVERARHLLLVVHADRQVHLAFREALAGTHWECRGAPSARTGLHMALERRPSLVALDVNLPGLDGREVLQLFQGHPELDELPVALLSGPGGSLTRLNAVAAGPYETVETDTPPRLLPARLDRILRMAGL